MDVRLVATRFVEAYNATLAVARDVLPERLAVDDDDDARARAPARGRIVARALAPTDAGATTDMTTTTVSDDELHRNAFMSSQPSLAFVFAKTRYFLDEGSRTRRCRWVMRSRGEGRAFSRAW